MELKESDFASWFEDLLDTYGYRWMHQRPARVKRSGQDVYETAYTGHKGFLDYVICHEQKRRLLFVELKSEKGKLSPDQQLWFDTLKECVRQITLVPIPKRDRGGYDPAIQTVREKDMKLIPSFEVYVWKPSDRDYMEACLK